MTELAAVMYAELSAGGRCSEGVYGEAISHPPGSGGGGGVCASNEAVLGRAAAARLHKGSLPRHATSHPHPQRRKLYIPALRGAAAFNHTSASHTLP